MNGVPVACSGNGLDVETFHSSGFSDLPTAFRDDNENFAYDSGEPYFDNLASTTYKGADGKFNGPQCQGALCGTGQANKTYVRKAVVMIMSGSKAYFSLWQDDVKVYEDRQGQNILNNLDALTAIPAGKTAKFTVKFYDSADQIMPSSTTLNIGADKGELLSTTYTVPKTNNANAGMTDFFLKNTGTASSQVVLTVNTPSGVETLLKFNILLQ